MQRHTRWIKPARTRKHRPQARHCFCSGRSSGRFFFLSLVIVCSNAIKDGTAASGSGGQS
jgi:hypothetical protein